MVIEYPGIVYEELPVLNQVNDTSKDWLVYGRACAEEDASIEASIIRITPDSFAEKIQFARELIDLTRGLDPVKFNSVLVRMENSKFADSIA